MSTVSPPTPAFRLLIRPSRRNLIIALSLSLAFAIIYGILALQQAFGGEYVVQDDARQHIFWMQRYLDPGAFPNDLIADYFQSAAPLGYDLLYRTLARLGLEPHLVARVLPFFLGLIAAGYGFFLCFEIFPVPLAAFITSAILNQGLWGSDEISSGTPRAFLYPLFLAFSYYLIRRSYGACGLLLILQAVLYPPILLISVGLILLRLVRWEPGKLAWSPHRAEYLLGGLGIATILGLKWYTDGLSDFGPMVSVAQARSLPEFQAGGRNAFFVPGVLYWLHGYPWRSGFLHRAFAIPVTAVFGIFLPLFLAHTQSPLKRQIRPEIRVLWQMLLVSFGLFFLAHLLLFTLHLPSRYTSHTIRVVLAVAAGIFFTLLFDDVTLRCQTWRRSLPAPAASRPGFVRGGLNQLIRNGLRLVPIGLVTVFFGVTAFYYPLLLQNYPKAGYLNFDDAAPLYEFVADQPQDTLTASLSKQADSLPSFTGRSVLVSREHALAYHTGYYDQMRQRVEALIQAQYTLDPAQVSAFIDRYDIDLWLLDAAAFEANYLAKNRWLRQFQPMTAAAIATLSQSAVPVVQQSIEACTIFQTPQWTVLDATCVGAWAGQL